MSTFIMVLSLIVVVLLLVSLGYTFFVAKTQKELKGEQDISISDEVKRHPYMGNPIFLAMGIAAILIVLYIIYMMVQ